MTDLTKVIQKLLINEEFMVGGYKYTFLSVESDDEGIFYDFVIIIFFMLGKFFKFFQILFYFF
jgi:hypothetical protein